MRGQINPAFQQPSDRCVPRLIELAARGHFLPRTEAPATALPGNYGVPALAADNLKHQAEEKEHRVDRLSDSVLIGTI
jgi:hypothetical protein